LSPRFRRPEGLVALGHRGYRLYFVSMLARGTAVWMLFIAIPWLAVERGATPLQLGIVSGCLFLPALFLSPFGGVLADRVDRLKVLLAAQVAAAAHSIILFGLVVTGNASLEVLAVFSLVFGALTAAELPVRQSFLTDLVPPEEVSSAVSLHATAWNTTRFVGPAIAGVVIATIGVAGCFAVSTVATALVALAVIRQRQFTRHQRSVPSSERSVLGALGDGIRYAARSPRIRWALLVLSAGGILGIQAFQTLAPLYVSQTLGLGGGAYGGFMAVWGAGALVGTMVVTLLGRGDRRAWVLAGAASLSGLLGVLSVTRSPAGAFAVAALLGLAQISMIQSAMITVQQATTDEFRGRVMGLYATLFQGTNPMGAVLAGGLATTVGVTGAMLAGAAGLAAVVVIATFGLAIGRVRIPARPGSSETLER
jgi:MFS family permease